MVLFFILLMCITEIAFHVFNCSRILGINSTGSWCIIFLYVAEFASILLRIYTSIFIRDLISGFLFL